MGHKFWASGAKICGTKVSETPSEGKNLWHKSPLSQRRGERLEKWDRTLQIMVDFFPELLTILIGLDFKMSS